MKLIVLIFKDSNAECGNCGRIPMWDWGGAYCYTCHVHWVDIRHGASAEVMTKEDFERLFK